MEKEIQPLTLEEKHKIFEEIDSLERTLTISEFGKLCNRGLLDQEGYDYAKQNFPDLFEMSFGVDSQWYASKIQDDEHARDLANLASVCSIDMYYGGSVVYQAHAMVADVRFVENFLEICKDRNQIDDVTTLLSYASDLIGADALLEIAEAGKLDLLRDFFNNEYCDAIGSILQLKNGEIKLEELPITAFIDDLTQTIVDVAEKQMRAEVEKKLQKFNLSDEIDAEISVEIFKELNKKINHIKRVVATKEKELKEKKEQEKEEAQQKEEMVGKLKGKVSELVDLNADYERQIEELTKLMFANSDKIEHYNNLILEINGEGVGV